MFQIEQLTFGHMSFLKIIFVFLKKKFVGLIPIVKVFATKMMTRGTPWNIH